ncbi:fumarylacetoacetate hydrolase family protein [Rhodococcus sp. NPDC057014]|uniref:fumarylacetoacetate hydrolase family protein n=1 Tax=Rhodococcus sp. NPDC057014 TaxID=3346000 RepID=UPI00363166E5
MESVYEDAQTITQLLTDWRRHEEPFRRIVTDSAAMDRIRRLGQELPVDRLLAPTEPRQLYCAIGNYRTQVVEAAVQAGSTLERATMDVDHRRQHGAPFAVLTPPNRVGAPFAPIALEKEQYHLDWEVELAVVIGRRGWRVPAARARSLIAGFTVANDLTLRDRVMRPDVATGADWLRSKGTPGTLPLGPWLVPAWQVPRRPLALELTLNGHVMQSSTTADMIFRVEDILEEITHHTVLEPGDVVCTGSPAGFGAQRDRYLKPGDVTEAAVELLGRQRTEYVHEAPTRQSPDRDWRKAAV